MTQPRPLATRFARVPRLLALPVIASLGLLWMALPANARDIDEPQLFHQWPVAGDLPAVQGDRGVARAPGDTLFYGYYNGTTGLANEGYPRGGTNHTWTFDHGAPDAFEGWYATDLTANLSASFRQITTASWAGHSNAVDAPILSGAGSAWVGNFEDEADDLCWVAGLGYGNSWCQRLLSPPISYEGGGATLSLDYFNDTENGFDYTRVILLRPNGDEIPLNGDGFTHQEGLATDHPASPPSGTTYVTSISDVAVGGFGSYQLIFSMESDGGWSDEDGQYTTEYGPFGADNVQLSGGSTAFFDFEAGLDGWIDTVCAGVGTFFGLRDVSLYTIQDPCDCELDGNVLEFHQDDFDHFPYGQHMQARSNPVDLTTAQSTFGAVTIGAIWDQYSELPVANGVFYRPGWSYYPYVCPETGNTGWSPRVGQGSFNFVGVDPLCAPITNSATDNGVPSGADQVRFIYEIYASCDAFGIPPSDCSNVTNFTPVIDNINVFATLNLDAPTLSIENGRQFQDGFSQTFTLSLFGAGRADCSRNENFGNNPPFVLEDVPQVNGPAGTIRPWSSKLHFRILREGPGAPNAAFADWQAWKTATGVGIGPAGSFAFGVMDTLEVAGSPVSTLSSFLGYYREDDPNNPSPGTELTDANEIIVDNIPPGTQVQYFFSAEFDDGVDAFLLPDTTGGHFAEFEILPSWRNTSGSADFCVDKFPAVLYLLVQAANPRLSPVERAVLVQAAMALLYGSPILAEAAGDANVMVTGTDLRAWDRYDYLDATSNWKAPFARGTLGSNNGVSLPQLLGYRSIMTDSGPLDFFGWPEDWTLMNDWLTAIACEGNNNPQGLHMNGDNMATNLANDGPALLSGRLGAGLVASAYNEDTSGGPPDENFCVFIDPSATPEYSTSNSVNGSYDYAAWGNWCPNSFTFDVLETQGSGVGNRVYTNIGNLDETSYEQVVTEHVGVSTDNYRTVIDGVSWIHTGTRDPMTDCKSDSAAIVTATFNEMLAAQEWVFDGVLPGLQLDPCIGGSVDDDPVEPPSGLTSRLVDNRPNPFNPRTVVRFTLAVAGKVQLRVYDTAGRLVRTLVDEEMTAGAHRATWDGTNDHGRKVPAGVYWSQLAAPDGYTSSKRMILIR